MPTHGWTFGLTLTGVIIIVAALTFFPALCLGPMVEHGLMLAGPDVLTIKNLHNNYEHKS